jgi:carbamoyltransferase
MSKIYGLYGTGHSASTTLIVDGEIIHCLEEERMTRIKSGKDYGCNPDLSLAAVQNKTGIQIGDVDHVVFAEPAPPQYARQLTKNRYTTVSHHTAHNYASYFTSGMEGKVLSISIDGGGSSSVGCVFACEDGVMSEVHRSWAANSGSLSQLWGFVTNWMMGRHDNCLFKWIMCKDEGKLMGMAPDGFYDPKIQKILHSIISYDNLRFFPSGADQRTKFVMERLLEDGFFDTQQKREIFSFNVQYFTEELVLKFIDDLHKKMPEYTKLCFSGGLFANVKLNQRINELPWVDEIYILPPMGDEGLSLGAAIHKAVELGEITKPFKLKNAYLGLSYTDEEISEIATNYNFSVKKYKVEEIADDLNKGLIIGWFQDKMEFGPRALGARSILVRPTDYNTHAELNKRLNRYDTMPFAPMVMAEYFEKVFPLAKSKYAAQFMTLTYQTHDSWMYRIPAVIQKSDKTARPQVVEKDSLPMVWELMNSYYEISGIPLLLNTSFNAHDEPIIENPGHAFVHLENKVIDKLVIGNYVYENK